jgi:hypothetical protein
MAANGRAGRSRAAEQGGHARRNVGHAVLGIDLPQPAHAALLIFLQQQATRFRWRTHVGVGLQLPECPARDREDADDGNAQA